MPTARQKNIAETPTKRTLYLKPLCYISQTDYIKANRPETDKEKLKYKKPENLSANSIRKIKLYTNLLCDAAKWKTVYSKTEDKYFRFKISFITLTLSSNQQHSDNQLHKKLLEPLLRILRRKHNMKLYIWKAETQMNGNIHYHITADIFIHHKKLREIWNKLQKKLGYIQGNEQPNSTDIHSVKNIKNLPAYLSKYISKNQGKANYYCLEKPTTNHYYMNETYIEEIDNENLKWQLHRKVHTKIWDCSNQLKQWKLTIDEDYNWKEYYSIRYNSSRHDLIKITEYGLIMKHNKQSNDIYRKSLKKLTTNTITKYTVETLF